MKVLSSHVRMWINELKGCVIPIEGYIKLLLHLDPEPLSHKQKKYLSSIETNQKKLLRFLDDVFDIHMIYTGQLLRFDFISFNLQDFAAAIPAKFEQLFPYLYLNLIVTNNANLGSIKTDAKKLEQIILYLLYYVSRVQPDDTVLKIIIDANDEELHIQLYNPDINTFIWQDFNKKDYFSFDPEVFLAKNYVKMLDGKTWIESEVGKGTTVHFTLPIAE